MKIEEKKNHLGGIDIFNNLPDPAIIIDPKSYTIIDANKVFLKIEGLPRRDVVGRKCYEITHKIFSPCKGALEKCPLRETLKTHKTATAEHIHYDSHNNPYYVDVITSFIKNAAGKELILHICRASPILKKLQKILAEKSKKYIKRLKDLSIRDPLTGVYNYRYLMERMPVEVYRAKRYDSPFSFIILDIDYFKSINDVYGHSVGDRLLLEFTNFIKSSLRQSDVLIRYGGEEFAILMPNTDKLGAQYLANRLITSLGNHIFKIEKIEVKLKACMGIATLSSDETCDSSDKLLHSADKALQRAKESGSNVIVTSSDLYKQKKEITRKISPYGEVNVLKRKISKLSESIDRVVLESMYAFAKSMEARDNYTAEHAEEMVGMVLKIGKEIGLSQDLLNTLERGATLHDIGKIGISDAILRKEGKLTSEEFEMIKMHPKIGAEIIRAVHFLKDVVPIVMHHHERWDGKGYPSGLKEREIPLLARIICIADVYQALISDRPYRKAYSKKEALKILKEEAGTHFDKDLVGILIRLETNKKDKE